MAQTTSMERVTMTTGLAEESFIGVMNFSNLDDHQEPVYQSGEWGSVPWRVAIPDSALGFAVRATTDRS